MPMLSTKKEARAKEKEKEEELVVELTANHSVHEKDAYGNSLIIIAIKRNHVHIVEQLLANGANIHDKDNEGVSGFLIVCKI